MIVFIPLFLYALFLDDLLRYALDIQEAAQSTVWDLTVQDYSKPPPIETVQHHARLMFCDHESGQDRFQDKVGGKYKDCADTDHHVALTAHTCWLGQGQQVTCDKQGSAASVGALQAGPLHSAYREQFSHGGVVRCSARGVVQNYLIPTQFLQEFSDTALANHQWQGSGEAYHDNAQQGTIPDTYIIEHELSILTDTWALTTPENSRPGERKGALYERVDTLYGRASRATPPPLSQATQRFFSEAVNKQLLAPMPTRWGDDPLKPNIAISPYGGSSDSPTESIKQGKQRASYFNTEWRDWERDNNKQTFERRKEGYMGCALGRGCP